MANARKTVLRGINEPGFVRGDEDVSLGRTTPDGATITWSGSDLEVESGQSTYLEESFRTKDAASITLRLLYSDLVQFKDSLGLPDDALTGDLGGAVPTEEQLKVLASDTLTIREESLYIITPGPKSTRRYEFTRVKRAGDLSITLSRDAALILEVTYAVLAPKDPSVPVYTITDAV